MSNAADMQRVRNAMDATCEEQKCVHCKVAARKRFLKEKMKLVEQIDPTKSKHELTRRYSCRKCRGVLFVKVLIEITGD